MPEPGKPTIAAEPSAESSTGQSSLDGSTVRAPKPDITALGRFFFGPRAVSSLALTGIFLLGLVAFAYVAKPFLLPVLLALLLNLLLKPVVDSLCRMHVPRPVGAAMVLVVFIGLISTGLYRLNEPASEWLDKVPEGLETLENKGREMLARAEGFIKGEGGGTASPAVPDVGQEPVRRDFSRFDWASKMVSVGAILGYTAGFLIGSLEMLVLLYFLLASGDVFLQKMVRVLPSMREKKGAVSIAREVEYNISAFLFTITIINSCLALVVTLVLLILGMPNPVLWGVVAGLLNFIPYFGPLTMSVLLLIAGFLSFESTAQALLPSVSYIGLHAVEANLITPTVLGRRLTLSPVIIFVSLLFWTWLWGMPGALLAVPLLMTFKMFCDHFKPLAPIGEFLSG